MSTIVDVLTVILTAVILAALTTLFFRQMLANITGARKSLLKACGWMLLGLIHVYALIDLVGGLLDFRLVSVHALPPSILGIYEGFVRAGIQFILDFIRWVFSLAG